MTKIGGRVRGGRARLPAGGASEAQYMAVAGKLLQTILAAGADTEWLRILLAGLIDKLRRALS